VIVITTNRTYTRSFVTQILRNGQPWYGYDNKTNDFNWTTMNHWFSSFTVSRNPLWYI